jgi:hypothetical protein
VPLEGTVAGRAYQLGEILPGSGGGRVLWVPMLDGADRAGVLRIGLGPGVVDKEPLRRRCWTVSGLLGHILISKVPYSERLRWMRSGGSLSASAELMWRLMPPRTFATDRLVVTALLEPWDRVAGDACDDAVNRPSVMPHASPAGRTRIPDVVAADRARCDSVTRDRAPRLGRIGGRRHGRGPGDHFRG